MAQSISKGVYLIVTGIACLVLAVMPGAISFVFVDMESAASSDFNKNDGVFRYTFKDIGAGDIVVIVSIETPRTADVNITDQYGSVIGKFHGSSMTNSTAIKKTGDYTVSITGVNVNDTFSAEYLSEDFTTYCCLGCLGTSVFFILGVVFLIVGIVSLVRKGRKDRAVHPPYASSGAPLQQSPSVPSSQPSAVPSQHNPSVSSSHPSAIPSQHNPSVPPSQPSAVPSQRDPASSSSNYHLPPQYPSQPYYISPTFQIPYYTPSVPTTTASPLKKKIARSPPQTGVVLGRPVTGSPVDDGKAH